jgi:two-component system LytT family sensor kinase
VKFKRLFWLINTSGWLLFYIIVLLTCYSKQLYNIKIIYGVAITYFAGFGITLILRLLYIRIYKKQRPVIYSYLYIALISIAASHIWYFLDISLTYLITGASAFNNIDLAGVEADIIVLRVPVFAAWSGLYYVIRLWNDLTIEKVRAEKADLLAHKAQLQMLRYQLNPHFLFNALNTIRALIEEDKEKAKQIIIELSEFLRYSLINKNNTKVDFADEVEAIKHYVEIQKIRYEEKLEVSMNIQPETEKFQILSFLIYPLVENAVKYGMKTSKLPLKVRINANMNNEFFKAEVINTGKWIDSNSNVNSIDRGTGTGLENVKLRLENAFGSNYSFNIKEENDTVIITLQIKRV